MPDEANAMQPWQTIGVEPVYECRVFSVKTQRSRSPRTGELYDFHVIESPDWVNIIPVTADGRVVMVRQYRHGIGSFTLEVPGGMVDPGDASPAEAGRREMREESGYDSDEIVPLGVIHPNPAIQSNRCHSFLARNARLRHEVSFDSTEETEVVLVPLAEVPELIRGGVITHALVVVAFTHLTLLSER